MGYMRHHAIIVTSHHDHVIRVRQRCMDVQAKFNGELEAAGEGSGLFLVGELSKETMNCYMSFLIQPDGSKEGWEDSKYGVQLRERIKDQVLRPETKGYGLDWVEVQYGDDEHQTLTRECNHCKKPNSIEQTCACVKDTGDLEG